jgi:hypothetical protein
VVWPFDDVNRRGDRVRANQLSWRQHWLGARGYARGKHADIAATPGVDECGDCPP